MEGAPELRRDDSGNEQWVTYLRQMLNHHYQQSVVAEDGEFDQAVENAVRHLQQQNGLTADGVATAEVWRLLGGQSDNGHGQGDHAQGGDHAHGGEHGQGGHGHQGGHEGGHEGGQINAHDYPHIVWVGEHGEQFLEEYFDFSHDAEEGEHARLIPATTIQAGRCADQYAAFMAASLEFANACREFGQNPGLSTGVHVVVAGIAWALTYRAWKQCEDNNPQLPGGKMEELDRMVETVETELQHLRAALPEGSVA